MKIIYLSHSTIPSRAANSVHVMKMCQAFAVNGHQVTLLARRPNHTPAADFNDYAYYGVKPIFEIVKCPLPEIKLVGSLMQALWARRAISRLPIPDLFYARRAYNLAAVAHLKRPMILEVHNLPSNRQLKLVIGWLLRQPHFSRLVAISAALGAAYQQIYPQLTDDRLLIASDGADEPLAEALASDSQWPGRAEAFQVGYTGHLYPGKGAEIITAVAAQLPDMDFHLVGGDDGDIQRWRSACPCDNLFFHGHLPHRRVAQYAQQFDVALAPYQDRVSGVGSTGNIARWMSPLKIFEYMALGKAIVCSDLPVLREILTDQRNALLVPPDDVAAWTAAIRRLQTDESLRRKLGAAARNDFLTQYSWKTRAQNVLTGLPSIETHSL